MIKMCSKYFEFTKSSYFRRVKGVKSPPLEDRELKENYFGIFSQKQLNSCYVIKQKIVFISYIASRIISLGF